MINLNATDVPDQLQVNQLPKPLPLINVACSERGTIVRIHTVTGEILGEYQTAPDGRDRNPSRTTVDHDGNVWVGNRDEASNGKGSVARIGIVLGGTRGGTSSESQHKNE